MGAPTAGREVHVRAPGKVNVFLKVGSRQSDGYHDVAIAYQAVSLYEDVRVVPADGFSVAVTGSVELSRVPTDERNIAIVAARLLAERTGYRGGVHIDVEKHVPVTGGMGGGSADAAATLLACDALWGTELPRDELYDRINRRVGAMLAAGWLDEVRRLRDLPRPLSREARQALGYRELLDFLDGCGGTLDETADLIRTHTRQFAKRQLTWFRHLPRCTPVPAFLPNCDKLVIRAWVQDSTEPQIDTPASTGATPG